MVVEDVSVDVECGITIRYLDYKTEVSLEDGQSFAKTADGWIDMKQSQNSSRIKDWGVEVQTGNWCIKAYTSALGGDKVAKVGKLRKKETAVNSITLKWNEVSDASGYEIFRSASKNGGYKKVATVKDGEKTTYKDSGLKKNTIYYYRVRAYQKITAVDADGAVEKVTTVGRMSGVTAVRTKKSGKG